MLIMVDAMGGDNAPYEIVKGCMDAINENDDFDILLIGDKSKINSILKENDFNNKRLDVFHTTEAITNEDSPVKAIKRKKDSSIVVGLEMIKDKKADVFLSAGNTGALMAGSKIILGMLEGVDRPALMSFLPTSKGLSVIVDAGANTMCKPVNLLQFGVMGSLYISEVFDVKNPKVGIVNVGAEENKGNDLVKSSYSMLKQANINFIGNIEGRQVLDGDADVIVCDGFVGNVLIKTLEGAAGYLFGSLKGIFNKNVITKLSGALVKKELKKFKKHMDYTEYGGVPLLGVNGKVIKAHGSSNAKAIKNAVIRAKSYVKSNVLEQIREDFKNMEVEDIE
ncbi:MAG TPA: phosphate acyltransferase PlsX [Pseudobacteroides sp.]|uniref:phosphate acyltransferase PlsX n=1 Tax=Pseudobacteroides sp. TaxID=1968840 RepID=UPI002F929AD9